MQNLPGISKDLVSSLSLQYEPVGVTLYNASESLPENIGVSQKDFKSYCHALVLAGEGETLLIEGAQMGCKLGTSVLGFEKEVERYLDDGVLEKYGVGLFETEEASAATILQSAYLAKGKTRAAFIAPLSAFDKTPQVVVFSADSEQVMWLLYAVNYEKGGKMDLPQSGGALGGCSDITVLPLTEGMTNITFLGLGCRMKSNLGPCYLMMGTPGEKIEMIHAHTQDLARPIAMLTKQRAGN